MDVTYRADLRELNELNFSRFDARLDQRLTALRADLEVKWTERWAALETKLERQKGELVRWMFLFWAPTALGVVAILLRG